VKGPAFEAPQGAFPNSFTKRILRFKSFVVKILPPTRAPFIPPTGTKQGI
jgi:hypothetical protein